MIYQRYRNQRQYFRQILASTFLLLVLGGLGGCSWQRVAVEGILIRESDPPQARLVLVDDKGRRYVLDVQGEIQRQIEAQNTLSVVRPGSEPRPLRVLVEGERYEARWYGHEHTYIRVERWQVKPPVIRSSLGSIGARP